MSVNMGTAVAYMDLNTGKFDSGVGKVQSAWKTLQDGSVSAATKFTVAGETLNSIGKDMTMRVTAPIVGLGAAALKSSIEFESAFTGVRKTVDATEEEYGKLSKAVEEMSYRMPIAATEIAGVMEVAGQLGVRGTENLITFTETMVMLGDTTNLSAEEAATAIARFQNIMGTAAEDVSRVGSTIVELGNNFATTEADITHMSQRLAAGGKLAGLTEPQILALAAAMSSVGIEAEAGGTAMTQTFTAIEKAVATGANTLKTYGSVSGMTAQEFAAAWKGDPMTALTAFISGLGRLDEEGGNAVLVLDELGLTGIRQSNMLQSLGLASDMMADAVGTANRAWDENIALQVEADKRYQTTESRLKALRNQLQGVGRGFGTLLLPILEKVMGALKGLMDWLLNLDEKTRKVIVTVALVVAAIGPVLMIVGKLIGSIGVVSKALSGISGPVGAAIAIIGALVAAFVLLYNTNEEFRVTMNKVWDDVKNIISSAVDSIKAVLERLKETLTPLKETFQETFAKMKEALSPALTVLVENLKFAFEQFKPILEFVAAIIGGRLAVAVSTLMGVLNGLMKALAPCVDILSALIKIAGDLVGALTAVLHGDFDKAGEYFADIWEQIKTIFSSAIEAVLGFVAGFGEAFWKTLSGLFGAAGVDFNQIIAGIVESIKEKFAAIGDWAQGVAESVAEFISGIGESVTTFFTVTIPGAFQAAVDWVGSAVQEVGLFFTETIPGWIESAGEWFAQLPDKIGFAIGYAIQTVINFGVSLWEWVTTELPMIIQGILEWFGQLPGTIWEFLVEAYENIVQWGSDTRDSFVETCTNIINSVVEWFSQLPGRIWEKLSEAYNNVVKWGNETLERGKSIAKGFLDSIVEQVRQIPDKFREWFDNAKQVLSGINLSSIGRAIMNSLWEGLKSVWSSISSWFEGVVQKVSSFLSSITSGMNAAKSAGSGSFASGLDYVPRTMNVQVHQGERILTQEEVKRGVGGGVVVNISVDANVAGDVDIDALAARLGRKIEREMRSRGLAGALV